MALIAQLGEHCTGIAEVVGSNPAQSLNFFSGLCSSSVTAALALMTVKKSNRIRNFKIQACTCESPSLTMSTISNALEDVKSSSDLVYHYMDFLTKLFLCILVMLRVFLNVRQ